MFEPYLKLNSRKDRQIISKFRTSCHDLEIERGRYSGVKAEDRKCKICSANAVEDELHFVLKCDILSDIRSPYITKLTTSFPNISKLSDEMKFIWIMSSEDPLVLSTLSKLLNSLFEKRRELLTNK